MDILKVALSQFGVTEVPGKKHNPTIVNYSKDIGYKGIIDDETAWCSIFINWCALKAGLERSEKLNARSWLDVGEETKNPLPGDIVVFWRESLESWKGHAGIFISYSEDKKFIYCLGGNQSNRVQITPYDKDRLLKFIKLGKNL